MITSTGPRHPSRDAWQTLPLTVTATAAGVASLLFLTRLAHAAGWGLASPLLPLTVDALAVAAWRCWDNRGGRYALSCGLLATALSIAGNAYGHAIDTGHATVGLAAVVAVAAVPAVTLALIVPLSRPATATAEDAPAAAAPLVAPAPVTVTPEASRPEPRDVTPVTAPEPVTATVTPEPQPVTVPSLADLHADLADLLHAPDPTPLEKAARATIAPTPHTPTADDPDHVITAWAAGLDPVPGSRRLRDLVPGLTARRAEQIARDAKAPAAPVTHLRAAR